jgi:branched-chain amino acid transport system permease protein
VAIATVAVVAVIRLVFGGSTALYVNGAAAGVLYGLMAVGLILIYRSNRFINLSVSAIGAVPAMVALILMTSRGTSYWVGLPIALVGGLAVGAVVDVVIIRRFAQRSRFTLTVVTLGVAQGLALVALLVPGWMGSEAQQSLVDTPWSGVIARSAGRPVLTGDQLFAVVAVALLCGGLALFLRVSRLGIGLRAAAENSPRAELLGVPVRRVQTVAWAFAGLLGAASIFLRAPLTGVPLDGTLGPGILLFALAVASVARFSSVGVALVAGVVVGILEQASVSKTGSGDLAYALMLAVVFVALVVRRPDYVRSLSADEADWDSTQTVRPLPRRLARLPQVQGMRALLVVASLAVAVVAPLVVTEGQIGNMTTIPLFGIVAVSMVVLTGWAGQMSLGQFGLVGVGALLGGSWAAGHGIDLFVALAVGTVGAALVAGLLAIPAVRVQGVYLAVVTMAFAGAMQFYFLDRRYALGDVGLLPSGFSRIERPVLWGRIDLGDDLSFYYLVLAFLVLAVAAVATMRGNRGGRVLMGIRDNAKEASAMALSVPRTRLAAFMVSGGLAGLAGALMAYQQGAVDPQVYGIDNSMLIFIVVVIGGVTSLSGALAATAVIIWVRLFGDTYLFAHADLMVTGPGLLVVLLIVPGGFADVIFRARDRFARWADGRTGHVRRSTALGPHVPAGVGE